LNVTGTSPLAFAINVTTMARSLVPPTVPHELWPRAPRWLIPQSALLLLLLLSLVIFTVRRSPRPVRVYVCSSLFLVCLFLIAACGGGSSSDHHPRR
jgi:hypothetical protein